MPHHTYEWYNSPGEDDEIRHVYEAVQRRLILQQREFEAALTRQTLDKLVSEFLPKPRKKSGFGKFITKIENA